MSGESEHRTIADAARSGVGWNAAGNIARLGLGLVFNVVLARLLGPAPFGLVAAGLLPVGMATLLIEGGLSAGLVQRDDITKDDTSFVHAVQTLLGLVLAVLIVISSPVLSTFFKLNGLTPVMRLLSLVVLAQGTSQAPTAILRRQFEFRRLQTANLLSYIAGYAFVGVPAAYSGLGVYSVVLAQVCQAIARAGLLIGYSRIGFAYRVRGRPVLLRFGSQLLGANLANWILSNADTAIIGRAFSAGSLGLYNRGMYLASAPVGVVAGSVQSVLFSAISRVSRRREDARRVFLTVLKLTGITALPLFGWLYGAGWVLVEAVLGSHWSGAAALMPALSIAMAINVLLALAGPLISGLGEAGLELRQTLLALFAAVPLLVVGAAISLGAVAWALAGARFTFFVLLCLPLRRLADIRIVEILVAVSPGLSIGVVEAIGAGVLSHVLASSHLMPGATLVILVLAGFVVGVVCVLSIGNLVLDENVINALGVAEESAWVRVVRGGWRGSA